MDELGDVYSAGLTHVVDPYSLDLYKLVDNRGYHCTYQETCKSPQIGDLLPILRPFLAPALNGKVPLSQAFLLG